MTGAGAAVAAPLPGGASSLVETYNDWSVVCQAAGDVTACVVRQVQSNSQTNQHLLTIEIARDGTDKLTGVLLLPLGLSLAQGAQLKIGETTIGGMRVFSTCIQQGCLAPFDITDETLPNSGPARLSTSPCRQPTQSSPSLSTFPCRAYPMPSTAWLTGRNSDAHRPADFCRPAAMMFLCLYWVWQREGHALTKF